MEVLKKSHFSLQMGNCPIPVAEDYGLYVISNNRLILKSSLYASLHAVKKLITELECHCKRFCRIAV